MGHCMKNKINPLTIQSKQWVLNALLELMEVQDFTSITITELSIKAGLDRKTFYRHFKTKEDVLLMQIDKAYQQYIESLKHTTELTSYMISKVYFDVLLLHIDFFRILINNGLATLVLSKWNEYLPVLETIFSLQLSNHKKTEYEMHYEAGGFWNVTVQWIVNDVKETPEEMAKIMGSLMLND